MALYRPAPGGGIAKIGKTWRHDSLRETLPGVLAQQAFRFRAADTAALNDPFVLTALEQRAFRFRSGDASDLNANFATTSLLDQHAFQFRGSDTAALNAAFGDADDGIPAMPTSAPAGWVRIFEDNFDQDVALGAFPGASTSTYPGNKWMHYDDAARVKDTVDKGTYSASKTIRISDGAMRIRIHTEVDAGQAATAAASTDLVTVANHGYTAHDTVVFSGQTGGAGIVSGKKYLVYAPTTNTFKLRPTYNTPTVDITSDMSAGTVTRVTHWCADPCPRTIGNTGSSINSNARLYQRMTLCMRVPVMPGYHIVPLYWPSSEVWPRDGEICWPECNTDGANVAQGFMHRMNGTSGSDQDVRTSTVTPHDVHIWTTEWSLNRCAFIVDGVMAGLPTGTPVTERVPSTPMRVNLQFETNYSTTFPDNSVEGEIEIFWITVDAPA